ncbi:MAG TPA: cupin domain-containing protein [Candidatus Deferrimicrobium sp.]|nr:cupin domain-containing protein [Candidatus Deferrimicrobium sp.]
MIVKKYDDVKKEEVKMADAKDTYVRWLIGEDSPAPHFHMRLFEIEPGGHSPFHSHDFEHEIYVLDGNGRLNTETKPFPLEKDSFALVMPGEKHQFENTGNTPFKFLCFIPKEEKCLK